MGDRISALRCMQQAQQCLQNAATDPQAPQLTYQLYQSSVISDPTFAEGWIAVGDSDMGYSRLNGAVAAYRRALELPDGNETGDINPERRAKVKVSMGECLRRLGYVEEALELNYEAAHYDQTLAYPWLNISQCLSTLGNMEGSLAAAKSAYALDHKDCKLQMGLAFAHLFARNYAEGLKYFEARYEYKLKAFLSYPYPKWQGEADKQVYLVADQGIGDTLSFARFVPAACKRAKFVHMAVQPELLRLFAASFQNIPNLNMQPLPCPWPPAEAWTTFMSLPWALGLNDQQIIEAPNISVPSFTAVSTQWKSPDRKLHIGVAWAGAPANDIDAWRSFALDHLLRLYEVPGIQLYSFQVGERAPDLHNAGAATLMRDLSPQIRDVSDTIGLLRHMDMVICCESLLAHICAMMGVECWIPYSYHGREFRIGHDGRHRLWSPHHRIYKQGPNARWEPVFGRIVDDLRLRVSRLREAAE
jgi:tetratricopeptide (TPR) repeat protein